MSLMKQSRISVTAVNCPHKQVKGFIVSADTVGHRKDAGLDQSRPGRLSKDFEPKMNVSSRVYNWPSLSSSCGVRQENVPLEFRVGL
jgi:hypothetical protein